MFERFTERARQVVVLAQEEARALRHNYIGTEHLLLGLLREEEGLGARALDSLGVAIDPVRARVRRTIGEGEETVAGQIPFTPRTKKALELALREALSLDHNYIGTEHLLLGLASVKEGVGAQILREFGVEAETIRETLLRQVGGATRAPAVGGVAAFREPLPRGRRRGPLMLVTGWLLFGLALGIGIVIGWAIWGS